MFHLLHGKIIVTWQNCLLFTLTLRGRSFYVDTRATENPRKSRILRNYWICVVAALILTLLVGSGTSNSGNSNNGNQHNTSSISGFTISSDNLNVASFAERFTPLGPVKFVFLFSVVLCFLSSYLHLFSSTFLSWLPSKSEAQGFHRKLNGKAGLGYMLSGFQNGTYGKTVWTLF